MGEQSLGDQRSPQSRRNALVSRLKSMSDLQYPIILDRAGIEAVLPHRGPMLFIRNLVALSDRQFRGEAHWDADHPLLRGHFPACPIVPGVMLVEAAAQLTGAGLLVADPVARSIGPGHVGMLTAIRKCFFKRPVRPQDSVRLELCCRRMGEKAVVASGTACIDGDEAARIEILVTHVPAGQLEPFLPRSALEAIARNTRAPSAGA